jgi:hypothetical protein
VDRGLEVGVTNSMTRRERMYRQALLNIEVADLAAARRLREIANEALNRQRKRPRRLPLPKVPA